MNGMYVFRLLYGEIVQWQIKVDFVIMFIKNGMVF